MIWILIQTINIFAVCGKSIKSKLITQHKSMQFKLLELDISSGWFMIQTVFQGHLCNEKECEFFANPTLSCSFLYIPFESIQDLNQFRALKLMQSKCCTIQILHDPNFEWSKSCKIQILHNPNSTQSKF